MSSTVQTQAIQATNDGIGAARTVMALYSQLVQLQELWTDVNVGTTVSSMATVALNPDGSFGAADTTPVATHPIDVSKYPGMSRALTSTEIEQM